MISRRGFLRGCQRTMVAWALSTPAAALAADGNGSGGANGNGSGGANGNGNSGGNGNGNGGNGQGKGGGNGNGGGNNGKGGGAGRGSGNSSPGNNASRAAREVGVVHRNGMKEVIRNGRYEMRDAQGRRIVNRQATGEDYARLKARR